jgi:hypothetical protein
LPPTINHALHGFGTRAICARIMARVLRVKARLCFGYLLAHMVKGGLLLL